MPVPDEFDAGVRFTQRPARVPPEYHFVLTAAILLIALHTCSRGGSSSIARLHFLYWSLTNSEGFRTVRALVSDPSQASLLPFPHHPVVDRALDFLTAGGSTLRTRGDRVSLGIEGRVFAIEVLKLDVLDDVRRRALDLGKAVTETSFNAMTERGRR